MTITMKLKLTLGLTSALFLIILTLIFILWKRNTRKHQTDIENKAENAMLGNIGTEREDLVTFHGGLDLTIADILDAPGEVIGKSNYGTLYKALIQRSGCVRLLRFLRPVCTARVKDFGEVVQFLGSIRHPNLVPLLGFYGGSRGEKLLIHPFFRRGSLADFIRVDNSESHNWNIIYRISVGLAKGLDHLHTGLQKPLIHGNLKSKNILLARNYLPCISDFGLHLLLNPAAGQEMLEASAAEGYKAPELIKMKDASEKTDIYCLGIIYLELLSGKEPISENPTPDDDFYLPTFMRNAVLDQRIADLYHPGLLVNDKHSEQPVTEERVIKYFQLAMSCCSPSPSLRPNINQVLQDLDEIGSYEDDIFGKN